MRGALALLLVAAALLFHGRVVRAESLPYRVWWSFPLDAESAIEVDEPDMHYSSFGTRWPLALELRRCDARRTKKLLGSRDGTPLREMRVESLAGDGQVRASTRCVLPLGEWRTLVGRSLVERLDDELDAHVSFLLPRKHPQPSRPRDPGEKKPE